MGRGTLRNPANSLRIAYFSPLPPARSGIADYSYTLLPHLASQAKLTVFVDDPHQIDADVKKQLNVAAGDTYPEARWAFDATLYQMGNSEHHESIYRMMNRFPGITVLHDYYLHLFIAHGTIGQENLAGYARELAYALGPKGYELAHLIRRQQAVMPLFELPLNDRVLDLSLGVMVHSQFAQSLVLDRSPDCQVTLLPPMIETRSGTSRRMETPWGENTVVFASIGQITSNKRLDLALRAFSQLRRELNDVGYLIVGEQLPEVDLTSLLTELDLTDCVLCTGHVETVQDFVDWVSTADAIVNLRHPTVGETSASALRAMASARPLVVFDHGWYGEIPDNACIKVPPLDETRLIEAMRLLAKEPDLRRSMGQAGASYVMSHCQPEAVANAYIKNVRNVLHHVQGQYA